MSSHDNEFAHRTSAAEGCKCRNTKTGWKSQISFASSRALAKGLPLTRTCKLVSSKQVHFFIPRIPTFCIYITYQTNSLFSAFMFRPNESLYSMARIFHYLCRSLAPYLDLVHIIVLVSRSFSVCQMKREYSTPLPLFFSTQKRGRSCTVEEKREKYVFE